MWYSELIEALPYEVEINLLLFINFDGKLIINPIMLQVSIGKHI